MHTNDADMHDAHAAIHARMETARIVAARRNPLDAGAAVLAAARILDEARRQATDRKES